MLALKSSPLRFLLALHLLARGLCAFLAALLRFGLGLCVLDSLLLRKAGSLFLLCSLSLFFLLSRTLLFFQATLLGSLPLAYLAASLVYGGVEFSLCCAAALLEVGVALLGDVFLESLVVSHKSAETMLQCNFLLVFLLGI